MAPYPEHAPLQSGDAEATSFVSLREILAALRRHKWLIFACTVIGSAAGTAALLSVPPTYTAESSIVIDARKPRLVDLPSLVAEQTTAPETAQIRSEVKILASDDLAARVITRLGLLHHPEFQKLLGTAGVRSDIAAFLMARFPWLLKQFPVLASKPETGPQQTGLAKAVEAYRSRLAVADDDRSYVITIQYRSHDPRLSERIVNTHVELYLADQVAYKQQIGKQASAWLTRELANLQTKLQSSEQAVQRFREEHQIVQSGDTTLLAQQLAAVNAEIPVAQTATANAEARLKHARDLLQRGMIDAQPNVLDSTLIQRLREDETEVLRRQSDLRAMFGDQYPSVRRVDSELRDVREKIKIEVGRIVKSLENEVQIAHTKENELRRRLAELEGRTVVADRAEAQLRDLQREVTANSSLIEVLLTRYKQVSAQEQIQQPDARVVSMATIPINPSFPRLRVHVPIIVATSLLFGIALAFLKELMRRGFKGSHEIEMECELPSLGSVPMIPRAWPALAAPHDLVTDQPLSAFAEAIRYIRNSMRMIAPSIDAVPNTVLITSSLPHEGKSVLALSLARSFARAGKKTLIIDCDVRNPSMRKMIGEPPIDVDLAKVLSREIHWQDAIWKDAKSAVEVIGGDPAGVAPHDLVSSSVMRELIDQCRRHYDVVILDSPPITAVSDTLTLSRWVDATMLVVRWGVTPREIAKTSLNKLFHNGARLCGVVLTQVDMRRAVFSPAEFEYYHKQNKAYYVQ